MSKQLDKLLKSGVLLGSTVVDREPEVLPSGVVALDHGLFLHGGIPVGQATVFYGKPDGGKSCLAGWFAGQAHEIYPDKKVLWNDSESRLLDSTGLRWLEHQGIDLDRLLVNSTRSMDKTLTACAWAAISGEFSLMVIDTVTNMYAGDIDDPDADVTSAQPAGLAMACRVGLPYILQKATETKTTLIIIAQARTRMGERVTSWGENIRPGIPLQLLHDPAVRLKIYNAGHVKEKGERVAWNMGVVAERGKGYVKELYKKKEITVRFADGRPDNLMMLLKKAKAIGVVAAGGSWLTWQPIDGEKIHAQGQDAFRAALEERGLDEEFEAAVIEAIKSTPAGMMAK